MAVNDTRSMVGDFQQGNIDSTYMQLTPDRGNVENPPIARMTWPTYRRVELHEDPPFLEAHVRRLGHPTEVKTTYGGEARY